SHDVRGLQCAPVDDVPADRAGERGDDGEAEVGDRLQPAGDLGAQSHRAESDERVDEAGRNGRGQRADRDRGADWIVDRGDGAHALLLIWSMLVWSMEVRS